MAHSYKRRHLNRENTWHSRRPAEVARMTRSHGRSTETSSETHLPAEQTRAQETARLSSAQGDQGWQAGSGAAAGKGPQAPLGLTVPLAEPA